MLKINNFLIKSNLKRSFKEYKSKLLFSFMVGVLIGSIPYLYKSIEHFRIQKIIQKELEMKIQNKEKICKNNNSDYEKFLSLGFPNTAIEKFNICMKGK